MGITLSVNGTEVSTSNPFPTALPLDEQKAGFAAMLAENDDGTNTSGVRDVRPLMVSPGRRLCVGVDVTLFDETFPLGSTTINSSKWLYTASTMTATIASGAIQLNAGNSTTSGQSVFLFSQPVIPMYGGKGLKIDITALFPFNPVTNNVAGIGLVSTPGLVAAVADGVGIRLNAAAQVEFVVFGAAGADADSVVISNWTSLVTAGVFTDFTIYLHNSEATLYINGKKVASLSRGSKPYFTSSAGLKAWALCQNTGTTASAQQVRISNFTVTALDESVAYTPGLRSALIGDMGYQYPTGQAIGTIVANTFNTVQWANSANPTAAVPTNTTAALGNGLGGQFWETYSLALNVDGIISSFQVPASGNGLNNKKLVVSNVTISSVVQTTITGGGLIEQWGLAFGHTAVSLATAEAAAAKIPRRKVIGMRSTAAAAAALVKFDTLSVDFHDAPIVVNPGEFIQVFKKNVGGTVGTAGVVIHTIDMAAVWV